MEAKLLSIETHDPIMDIARQIEQAKRKTGDTEVVARLVATRKQKDRIKYHLNKAKFKPRQHDLGGDQWEIIV